MSVQPSRPVTHDKPESAEEPVGYFIDPAEAKAAESVPTPNFNYVTYTPLPQTGGVPETYFSSAKPESPVKRERIESKPRPEKPSAEINLPTLRKFSPSDRAGRRPISAFKKKSTLPLWIAGLGLAGLAAYFIFSE